MGDNVKKCSNCGEILSKDDIYCPKCGSKYEEISNENKQIYCSKCGNPLESDAKFCSCCGEKVPNEKEIEMNKVIEGSKNIGQTMAIESNKKRFCPNCGTEIGENDRFCGSCGSSIEEDRGYTTYNQNVANEIAATESVPQNIGISNEKNEAKKLQYLRPNFSKKTLACILGGIGSGLVVIAIIAGLLMCYTGKIDGTKIGVFKNEYAIAKVDSYLNEKDYKSASDYAVLAQSKKPKDTEFLTTLVGKINPYSPLDAYTMVEKYIQKVGENKADSKIKKWYEIGKTPIEDLNISPIGGNYIYPPTVTWEVNQNIIGHGIYYTVDGSEPNENSPKYYTTGLKLPGDCILKLYAVNGAGEKTEVKSFEYEIDGESQKKIEEVYKRAEKTYDEAVIGDDVGQCLESAKADLKKAIDWTNEKIASPASDIATGELIVSELNAKIKALEDSKVVKTDRGALKSEISSANSTYNSQKDGQYYAYLVSDLKVFKNAIDKATEISKSRNPSQDDIDNAVKSLKNATSKFNGAVQTVKMDTVYNQYRGDYSFSTNYDDDYKYVYLNITKVQGGKVYGSFDVSHYTTEMGYDKSVSASKELKGVKISNGKITFDISGTSTYYNEGEYTYNEFYNSFDYEPGNTEAKEYTSHVTVSFVQPGTVQMNLSNIGDGVEFNEAMYRTN